MGENKAFQSTYNILCGSFIPTNLDQKFLGFERNYFDYYKVEGKRMSGKRRSEMMVFPDIRDPYLIIGWWGWRWPRGPLWPGSRVGTDGLLGQFKKPDMQDSIHAQRGCAQSAFLASIFSINKYKKFQSWDV